MSSPGFDPGQMRRLLRIASGTGVGLMVLFGLVIGFTWLAMTLSGLDMGDPPTRGYLVLNLVGSGVAGILAGMVSAAMGRSILPPTFLALLVLALGAATGGGAAASGQPAWYPLTVTLLAAIALLTGAMLVRRSSDRVEARSGIRPPADTPGGAPGS